MTSQAQTTVPDKASVHRAVLREASFEDYRSIADLHGRNGLMIRSGEDWRALADREIARYRADMEALRILPPTRLAGAVEALPLIGELSQELA